ncbi:hypothetical protein GCM10027612_29700 [Microbispora bryophytorum subsp. camponoti]
MIARATVRPPTPLSKIPIALVLSSGTLPKVRGLIPAADGKNAHTARRAAGRRGRRTTVPKARQTDSAYRRRGR